MSKIVRLLPRLGMASDSASLLWRDGDHLYGDDARLAPHRLAFR
jgi:hypothetical protein